MRERERNGVSLGQPVRDLDGASLGKVVRLFEFEFHCRRRLFGRSHVVRYDEVRGVREGTLVVARSRLDLFELAAGSVPRSWRIPTPPSFPSAATPPEARGLLADVAAGRVVPAELSTEPARPPEEPAATVLAPARAGDREVARPPAAPLAPQDGDAR